MLRNYLKKAWRSLTRPKSYFAINIAAFTIGLTCCLLIFRSVTFEYSLDRFRESTSDLYEVVQDIAIDDHGVGLRSFLMQEMGTALSQAIPEMPNFAGLRPKYGRAHPAEAERPSLKEADRVRLAEAFRLADSVQDHIWPTWSEVPFAVLLVTPEQEFLVRHPSPTEDFVLISEYDSLLQGAVYARDRQLPANLLATFPAVGGLSTVVVGRPKQTDKSSTFWVLTLLHEHFHQLQNAQPNYQDAVEELNLADGDETGMWMLNYPFPYNSEVVGERFAKNRDALQRALGAAHGPDAEKYLRDYLATRARLRETLEEADYRYLSFQLWQEGVARYTEYRVAVVAADQHEPLPSFQALGDFVPYSAAADSLRLAIDDELANFNLASRERVSFYSFGAAEALLLDAVRPGWRQLYLTEKFYLEQYYERQ